MHSARILAHFHCRIVSAAGLVFTRRNFAAESNSLRNELLHDDSNVKPAHCLGKDDDNFTVQL